MSPYLIQFLINMVVGVVTAILTTRVCKMRFRRTGHCPICGFRDRMHHLEEEESQ